MMMSLIQDIHVIDNNQIYHNLVIIKAIKIKIKK